MHILRAVLALALLALVACQTPQPAQPSTAGVQQPAAANAPKTTTYKIGASAINDGNLPLWLGIEHGIYAKNGVQVEYTQTGTGETTIAALTTGELSAAFVGPSNVAGAVAAGSDIRTVMAVTRRAQYLVVVGPGIDRIEDLRGKSMAIANPGGAAAIVAEILLNQYGMKGRRDVTYLNLGTEPARVEAMQSGQVQAALISPAFKTKLPNARVLLDLRDMQFPYVHGAMGMTTKFMDANPKDAEAIVKSTWEGEKFLLDPKNKAAVIDSIKRNLNMDDAGAADGYNEVMKDYEGSLPPSVTPEQVSKILEVLAADNPLVAKIAAKDMLDTRFVDKLTAEGFK
jgi:NitT/TauT family transport system substrate-binding protein